MWLRPDPIGSVPEKMARGARAVFRTGHLCLRVREDLRTISTDEVCADLFPPIGRPAEAPWRLALISVLQLVEDRSDRQAAEAARARMDWTYVRGVERTDPGCDVSLLTDVRARLLSHQAKRRVVEHLVRCLSAGGWITTRGVPRTDSTPVLAAVRRLTRVELLGEMLRAAPGSLDEHDPDWLTGWVPVEWLERSSCRIEAWRVPGATDMQEAIMEYIGQDDSRLLSER